MIPLSSSILKKLLELLFIERSWLLKLELNVNNTESTGKSGFLVILRLMDPG